MSRQQVWNFLQGMEHRGSSHKTEICSPIRTNPHPHHPQHRVLIRPVDSVQPRMLEMLSAADSALLMGFFAVFFSSRPVVDLTVSMTFTPDALPMAFKDKMDVELCFKVDSSAVPSEPGNGCLDPVVL